MFKPAYGYEYFDDLASVQYFFERNFSESEQERRSQLLWQAQTLDLSSSKFHRLGIDFEKMTDVETLILTDCHELKTVNIKNGHKIKKLYLSGMKGKLKELLTTCPDVQLLEITDANLTQADLLAIASCKKLEALRLNSYVPRVVTLIGVNLEDLLLNIPEISLMNFSFSTSYQRLTSNDIRDLSLRNSSLHSYQLASVIIACKNLKSLDLESCCYNFLSNMQRPDYARFTPPQPLELETVNINNISQDLFPPFMLLTLLEHSPNLKCLKLAKCNFLIETFYQTIKNNECLSHEINEIDFTDCSSLNDEILNGILHYFPKLKKISIRNCNKITQRAFDNTDLSGLVALDISGCNQISDDYLKDSFANMQELRSLQIEGRAQIREDIFDNACLPNLLSVGLKDCVFLSDKCLAKLFIATCEKTPSENTPSASIRSLNLRNCRLITGAGLYQSAFDITNLTCLILRDCVNLKSYYWSNIKMSIAEVHGVDTIGCDELPKSDIGQFVSPLLTYFGISFPFSYYLRWQYISQDAEMIEVAREMLDEAFKSLRFEEEYEAAAYAINQRNLLKEKIRNLGDPIDKIIFDNDSLKKFGHRFGPKPEELLDTKELYIEARRNGLLKVPGKQKYNTEKDLLSAEEAIGSASRTRLEITDNVYKRLLAGSLFLSVEAVLLWHRVNKYENRAYGLTSELSGKMGAFVLVRALGGLSIYLGAPLGCPVIVGIAAEFFLAIAGDKIGRDIHSHLYRPVSKQYWNAYVFWQKPKDMRQNNEDTEIVPMRKQDHYLDLEEILDPLLVDMPDEEILNPEDDDDLSGGKVIVVQR